MAATWPKFGYSASLKATETVTSKSLVLDSHFFSHKR